MHLVNAEMGGMGIQTATTMAKIIRGALDIVKEHFDIDLDEATIAYYRFMVHLKFFAQRVVMSDMSDAATESRDRQLRITVCNSTPMPTSAPRRLHRVRRGPMAALFPRTSVCTLPCISSVWCTAAHASTPGKEGMCRVTVYVHG